MTAKTLFGGLLILAPAVTFGQHTTVPVPGSNVSWEVDPKSAKVDGLLGRQAIFLRGQAPPAFASGLEFADGTIEFDMAPLDGGNFVGLVWRYATPLNHENIYFRLHRSGSFEAVQYAPRVNGAGGTWQLYPEFMAQALLPPNTWVHVRAVMRGSRLQVFVGDSTTPLLTVARQRGLPRSGRVGFWGRVNDKPEQWTAAISNIEIKAAAAASIDGPDTSAVAAGTLTGWRIAGPYAQLDSTVAPATQPNDAWSPIPLEEGGLLNISRQLQKPPGGRHVVFLRNTVRSAAARTAQLEIGYSDDVMVWINGVQIFRGTNALGSRYPGFLGLIASPVEYLYLPLRAGDNDLLIAVGERIAGWGLKVRVVP